MIEIVLLFVVILLNGLFAMSEIAMVSARKALLHQRAEEGEARAHIALELASAPGAFLSTIQIGITLIGILTGAIGGAAIAEKIQPLFLALPLLAPYAGALSLGLVVLVITFVSLVVGELAPKQIGLYYAERVAILVAPGMKTLSRLASPFVHLLSLSTDLVLALLGLRNREEPAVTEEEIKLLIGQGTAAGVFEQIEQQMVEKIFHLGDRRVEALMMPRAEIVWLDPDAPPEELVATLTGSGYDLYPVAERSLDNILGVAYASDLLAQQLAGQPLDLRASLLPALFVPESMPIFQVLERFRENSTSMALAINEYGGVDGMVTLRDVLEAIVGEIPEADEPYDPDIIVREDGSWLLDGMLAVYDLLELLGADDLPGIEEGHYQTLGGFAMTMLGKVPHAGEHYQWGGYRFEVVDMDGNRVDKILVSRLPAS